MPSAAAEESNAKLMSQFISDFGGRWFGKLTVTPDPSTGKKPETTEVHFEGGQESDGRCYHGRYFHPVFTATWLAYYDTKNKQIITIWVRSDGRSMHETATKTKDGWRVAGKGSDPNGDEVQFAATVTVSDGGKTHVWDGKETVGNQPPTVIQSSWTRVHDLR